MPENCLYEGEVMHQRLRPMKHRFVYRVFSVLLDLDDVPSLPRRLRLFAYNRFGLFSFHDADHGARDGSPLRPWMERQLAEHGIACDGGRIFLHCFPRLLGYAFNPLSVFWCYDRAGALRAVVYEVKNTFGEQHCYLFKVTIAHRADQPLLQQAAKNFYVSPFIEMEAEYHFRVYEPEAQLSLLIRETVADGDLLLATHTGHRRPLTDAGLLRAFVLFPLMTLKVILGIHWEALRLWLKGAKLQDRPAAPTREVTSWTSRLYRQRTGLRKSGYRV